MFGKLKEKLTGGTARLNGRADLLEGICAACVMVGAADGDFSDAEAQVALDRLLNHETISVAFSSSQIETAFDKQAKRAKSGMSGRIGLTREVEDVKKKSTSEDMEMLFMIAIDVASADGDIGAKEKGALDKIGTIIGLSLARYLE
ncbi:TerB family tellurite resistance protein [Cypionkella sp.]|uniref:tellurite resistance TerB family protein n=1 Tax=Cypionkella sp. TaxID=2811411 RepID=UPI00271A2E85|nr:TerB family tellurite resistance protein [Cypionkella sp.]MDO8982736.1 TerB family tellurite resistance protein [Cypionkella sp.]MDP2050989.1 TerB family tellurite resistance protein [Cypionkella sp.]